MASRTLHDSTDPEPPHGRQARVAAGALTGDQYIQRTLGRYAVAYDADSPAVEAANALVPHLQRWAGSELAGLHTCGSFAKHTAVTGRTGIDILVSLKPTATSLAEAFLALVDLAEARGWAPKIRAVSVGITFNGVAIDLVPGRLLEGYRDYHAIWLSRSGTWTQTNVSMHTERVRDSGRTREVRALKIWGANHSLIFPSFYLELTVLAALAGYGGDLGHNVQRVLGYLADQFSTAEIYDPANSLNRISDGLSAEEKKVVVVQAIASYNARSWDDVLW
jgi:hypothetical protein